jgi:DNA polymerase-3 subunit delta'
MLAPFQSLRKFLIIEEADRMLTYSANALLKTLEEPPPTTTLILISHEPQFILPTLLSRCQRVSFTSLSVDELTSLIQKKWDKPQEEAHNLALLSRGSMGRACRFIDQKGNTLRNLLLEQLALGSFNTHRQRVEFSQKLEEEIEKLQKMEEDQEEEKKLAGWGENLPATLRDSIQKEIEGAMTRRLNLEAALLFDELLFWFRDLHLLQVGADPSLLFHPDWKETLQQRVQRGHLIPLTAVQKAVEEAKLSLVRMTSLSHCFENLFLQLDSQT